MHAPVRGISPALASLWAFAITAVSVGAEATIETATVIDDKRANAVVPLGGLSDLAPAADGSGRLWATTDRGPNGTVNVGGKKVRTLLSPTFTPEILEIELAISNGAYAARVCKAIPLAGRSGTPFSGRPNCVGRDEPILDAESGKPLPGDPNGVDTEGVVHMPDGSFWMAEEYRPSLLHVSPEGRVLERFVPEGTSLSGADAAVHECLPAAYGARRDNRGFESIAVSPDGKRLWALLQSPLDNGKPKAVAKAGNVRLLAFDPVNRVPAGEYLYRLGDPADPDYLAEGAAPDDGKLCVLATVDFDTLLTIESSDKGLARLYRIDVANATNTLGRETSAKKATLEEIRDLPDAGIVPVRKTLVADLAPLVPGMRRDVYGEQGASGDAPLKLEGMAILGPDRVAIVNDNDFGVNVKPGAICRSCLWVIRLSPGLDADTKPSAR